MKRHPGRVGGSVTGFDRLLFRGILRSIGYVEGLNYFMGNQRVPLQDFKTFVSEFRRLLLSPGSSGPNHRGPVAHLDILLERAYHSPRMSTKDERNRIELLQGTLDLLILRTLLWGPAHGHAIAKNIERNSEDVLQVEQGSLYPALHRLIKRGWIAAEAGTSENNRRAKYYRLTARGRKQLNVETTKWDKLAGAIARILRPAKEPTE